MTQHRISRRSFIGAASCAAVGSTTFFSTLFNLQSMNAASVANAPYVDNGEDYRALVCIMLGGGNDSYNMLVPTNTADYNTYKATRSNLALAQDQLLKLDPVSYNQNQLGLHPAMPELKGLFDQGKVALICNVGTLVQPMTKAQYENSSGLPFGLFSHNDQDQQWQTSVPHTASPTGWAGRLADMVQSANTNSEISMNISLSGKNLFQLGGQSSEYSIVPTGTGSRGIIGYEAPDMFNQIRKTAVQSLMEQQYQDVFKKTYADVITGSQNAHELFSTAVETSTLSTQFSNNELSDRLKMVARTINVRQQLGMKRQTFFIRFDGWDHHDEVLNNQNNMLGIVSKGMTEFQAALEEIGIADCVTTFTVSDFARTLSSNGNGTDHAWGGNAIVMGNQVKGKEVYGTYPSLELGSELELGGGVLIPQISTDEYFAEMALWYGINKTELVTLFPNIGNFYNTMSSESPLGFMNLV